MVSRRSRAALAFIAVSSLVSACAPTEEERNEIRNRELFAHTYPMSCDELSPLIEFDLGVRGYEVTSATYRRIETSWSEPAQAAQARESLVIHLYNVSSEANDRCSVRIEGREERKEAATGSISVGFEYDLMWAFVELFDPEGAAAILEKMDDWKEVPRSGGSDRDDD